MHEMLTVNTLASQMFYDRSRLDPRSRNTKTNLVLKSSFHKLHVGAHVSYSGIATYRPLAVDESCIVGLGSTLFGCEISLLQEETTCLNPM